MRYSVLTLVLPCALLLSACTTVEPAFKDTGARVNACVEGGPDSVAQQFYDYCPLVSLTDGRVFRTVRLELDGDRLKYMTLREIEVVAVSLIKNHADEKT